MQALVTCRRANLRSGQPRAGLRALSALRLLAYPRQFSTLRQEKFFLDLVGEGRDPFAFLTHQAYLSRALSLRERVDAWHAHYSYELSARSDDYRRIVYKQAARLILWTGETKGHALELDLHRSDDSDYEGELTIGLRVDGHLIHRLSYNYNRAEPQLGAMTEILICRNQSRRVEGVTPFRTAPASSTPVYLCLAALSGIASADGVGRIRAVTEVAQTSYKELYAESLHNSYSGLWQALGGRPHGRNTFILDPSLPTTSGNKRRAKAREVEWAEIRAAASSAIGKFGRSAPPVPRAASIGGRGTELIEPPRDARRPCAVFTLVGEGNLVVPSRHSSQV